MEQFSGVWWAGWLALSAAAGWLFWKHPRVWIKLDVKEFDANGAKDSLLLTFHRQRSTLRGLITLVIALLVSLPFGREAVPFFLSVAAWMVLGSTYFFWYFNPNLSLARNLPYVSKYHVSWNPKAAFFPDRYVWGRAWAKVRLPGQPSEPPGQFDAATVATAGPMLQQLLNRILVAGGAVGALLLVAAFLLY